VTVTALITAPCDALFKIVSDPSRHAEMAGSGEVMRSEWVTASPVGEGSAFQSRQCVGWYQYPSRSYVQAYNPPYRFVWLSGPGFKKPPFGQLWGFHLSPVDARSTLVSHLMKWPILPVPDFQPFSRITQRGLQHELRNMKPTLFNLAKLAGGQVIGEVQVAYDWLDEANTNADRHASSFAKASPAK
jgi:hypothetical protein